MHDHRRHTRDIYKWFERKFTFDPSLAMYLPLVSRLRGTPARVEELVRGRSTEILTRRDGDNWSIQEHVGHLWDLEPLWAGRLEDFEAGAKTLRPADLQNRRTHEAQHNANNIESLLVGFRRARAKIVECLDGYDESLAGRSALHPRLGTPMRVIDLVYFAAEHDDHHLAHVHRLLKMFTE